VPIADPKRARLRNIDALTGEIPSPINPPSGCTFRTRCRYAIGVCAEKRPPLESAGGDRRCGQLLCESRSASTRARSCLVTTIRFFLGIPALLSAFDPSGGRTSRSGNCFEARPQPQRLYTAGMHFGPLEVFFSTIRFTRSIYLWTNRSSEAHDIIYMPSELLMLKHLELLCFLDRSVAHKRASSRPPGCGR